MKKNNDPHHELARSLALILIEHNWKIALAESCTGGLVSTTLTDLAGSSDWFERGYIIYSNEAKSECLDVPVEIIEAFGAVSEQVAKAMADGARRKADVNIAISITGIAGPTGGSVEKPVGTICFGWSIKKNVGDDIKTITITKQFSGDRQAVRVQACDYALSKLLELLQS